MRENHLSLRGPRLKVRAVKMASHQGDFPVTIRVECPKCGYFNPLALKFAEGNTADYEGVCESELEAGGLCGAVLLVTVTVPEDIEALEDIEEA